VDEPPLVNGRVSSRELYAAISSLREELASAQRAQTADVRAAVAATEHRLSARIEGLEATVNAHDDLIQQLRGARNLLVLIFGASVLTAAIGVLTLLGHVG
jgi:flagellin-like hook-associated protein FlgL